MFLGTLGVSLLANLLTGKEIYRAGKGKEINRVGEGTVRAGYGNKKGKKTTKWIFKPAHPLTNFEIQKYYQNEPRFNGVYSRDNLPKIKDRAYVINLDEYSDIGTHSVALYVQNIVTYFDYFGVEHIPKEIKTFIINKNIKTVLEYKHMIQ